MKIYTKSILYAMALLSTCSLVAEETTILTDSDIEMQLELHGYDYYDVTIKENQPPLYTPYLGDFDQYEDFAETEGSYIIDENNVKVVDQVYNKDEPLVLSGDIYLSGPVVIESDVILRDVTVHGTGAIFSTRNIHIMGNVESESVPYYDKRLEEEVATYDWYRTDSESGEETENVTVDGVDMIKVTPWTESWITTLTSKDVQPDMDEVIPQVRDNNEKGSLALVAKGNVMIGDIRAYERDFADDMKAAPYVVDSSDSAIGYIADSSGYWDGNYNATDGGVRPGIKTLGDVAITSDLLTTEYSFTLGDDNTLVGTKTVTTNSQGVGQGIEVSELPVNWETLLASGKYIAVYEKGADGTLTADKIYKIDSVLDSDGKLKLADSLPAELSGKDLVIKIADYENTVPRKFFEPTLSELEIVKYSDGLLDVYNEDYEIEKVGTLNHIDAIMYTDHMLGGIGDRLLVNGSMICHNRAFFASDTQMIYDIRAKNSKLRKYLPVAMRGPRTRYRREL